jgi:rubredoxin
MKQQSGQPPRNIFADKTPKTNQPTPPSQNPDFHAQSTLHIANKPQPQKRKQFQCIFCDVEYTTKNAWIRHETELHESPKKWQCPDCNATFLNEKSFTRHHKSNHSCHDCQHANEAKIELPRKTAWACGFCAAVFQNWEKRCEHVSSHFVNDGNNKSDWNFSNVISGLLTQKWVATAWQSLLAKHHGTNAEDQPKFQWRSTNPSCLELQQDLEHGQGEYEGTGEIEEKASRLEQLVQTAYRLGASESMSFSQDTHPVLPGDSESM